MKTSSAIMLSFRLSVYTFSSKFVNADGRIRTSGPITAGLLLSGEPHSTTLPHLLIVGPCHHGPPGTSLSTALMRRVGFEPTMFTTWVTVLQTACFNHLHTDAYGGRPRRPPFSYVSTIPGAHPACTAPHTPAASAGHKYRAGKPPLLRSEPASPDW